MDDEPKLKFWDYEKHHTANGLYIRPEPVSLDSLCGTYSWVFTEDYEEANEEFRYKCDLKAENKDEFPSEYPGTFEINFAPEKEQIPANFTGSFRLNMVKGKFSGLLGLAPIEAAGEPHVNCWGIKEVVWDPEAAETEVGDGHALEVSDVEDDNGNPFVTFIWHQELDWGDEGHVRCLAKKQVDENIRESLTDAERERLCMYLTDEEVEARAVGKGETTEVDQDYKEKTGSKRKSDDDEQVVKRKRED